jgi:hypothetical protein
VFLCGGVFFSDLVNTACLREGVFGPQAVPSFTLKTCGESGKGKLPLHSEAVSHTQTIASKLPITVLTTAD